MVIIELTPRGIKNISIQHGEEKDEVADFKALQHIKPRLMAIHAALKERFRNTKTKQGKREDK
jgi:hypothetical protein